MRRKTSPIWLMPKSELEAIVPNSDSFSRVLNHFNLKNKGANYKTLKRRLKEDKIDYSHIKPTNKGRKFPNQDKIPLAQILRKNSNYNKTCLKQRLLSNDLLTYRCSECGLSGYWNNKKLVLQLDHINGNATDNRLKNLRLLCPNCHSQTNTFAGRSLKKKYFCNCGQEIHKTSLQCTQCAKVKQLKIKWPSFESLQKMVDRLGYSATGRQLGVSDNAIRKRLKRKQ